MATYRVHDVQLTPFERAGRAIAGTKSAWLHPLHVADVLDAVDRAITAITRPGAAGSRHRKDGGQACYDGNGLHDAAELLGVGLN